MANSIFLGYFGTIPWSVSGTTITIDGSITYTGRLLGANGTAAAPSFAYASAPTEGLFYSPTFGHAFASSGVAQFTTGNGFTAFAGANYLAWNTGALAGTIDFDLRLYRKAAGVMSVGPNATTGVRLNASVDGTLAVQNFAGTLGATVSAAAYVVGATAGADFNGAVTNLTVVKGIVTAAS